MDEQNKNRPQQQDSEKDEADMMRTVIDMPAAEEQPADDDDASLRTFVGVVTDEVPEEPAQASPPPSTKPEEPKVNPFAVDQKPATSPPPQAPSTPTPTPPAEPKAPAFDPHATQMQTTPQEPPADMFSTMAPTRMPSASSTPPTPPTQQTPPPQKPTAATPSPVPPPAQQSAPPPDAASQQPNRNFNFNMGAAFERVQAAGSGNSIFANMGRMPLTAVYAGVVVLSALGLALFGRFLVTLLIYGDFHVVRALLGLLGLGLSVGFFAAFEYLPVLGGAQKRLDTFDLEKDASLKSIPERGAEPNPWYVGLAVILTVAGLLGGGLIFNLFADLSSQFADISEESDANISQFFAIVLGGFGGALVGGLGAFKEPRPALDGAQQRAFSPLQLLRPLGVGLGLIFLAASLRLVTAEFVFSNEDLIRFNAEDIGFYFLFALIGMYGIGGQSLRVMPLRIHRMVSLTVVALMAGIAAIAMMSVFAMLLDPMGEGSPKLRFAFSPRYLIFTMDDSLLPLMSIFGVVLAGAGFLAAFLTLQAFGEGMIASKTRRTEMLGLTFGSIFVTMLPMLIVFPVLTALPLGESLEAWLIWLIPFAGLLALLWGIHTRDSVAKGVVAPLAIIGRQLPAATPSWIRKPLQNAGATTSETLREMLPWHVGMVFVVVLSIIAVPLVLSFWFWIAALAGVLFVFGPKEPRVRPVAPPQQQPPPQQPISPQPTAASAPTPASPSMPMPTRDEEDMATTVDPEPPGPTDPLAQTKESDPPPSNPGPFKVD